MKAPMPNQKIAALFVTRAAKIRQGEKNNNRRNPEIYFRGSTTFLSPAM